MTRGFEENNNNYNRSRKAQKREIQWVAGKEKALRERAGVVGKTHGLQGENRSITNFSTELHSRCFPINAGLPQPSPHYLYHLLQAGIGLSGRRLFPPAVVIVGWMDYVPTASVLYKCNPTLPFPCVLHECSHNHSTYAVSVTFFIFTALPPATPSCNPLPLPLSLSPSLSLSHPRSTRASVEVLSRDSVRQESEACVMQGCCCCCC